MLRLMLVSLVIMIVSIMLFGNKVNNIKAHRTDSVSQAVQFMGQ